MVRHILADGREVGSIEGMVIPSTGKTAAVYRIVANLATAGNKILKEERGNAEKKPYGTRHCAKAETP